MALLIELIDKISTNALPYSVSSPASMDLTSVWDRNSFAGSGCQQSFYISEPRAISPPDSFLKTPTATQDHRMGQLNCLASENHWAFRSSSLREKTVSRKVMGLNACLVSLSIALVLCYCQQEWSLGHWESLKLSLSFKKLKVISCMPGHHFQKERNWTFHSLENPLWEEQGCLSRTLGQISSLSL